MHGPANYMTGTSTLLRAREQHSRLGDSPSWTGAQSACFPACQLRPAYRRIGLIQRGPPHSSTIDAGLAHGLRVDVALFSDGGQSGQICTYSSQAIGFGSMGHYWESTSASPPPVERRLPNRYGYEAVGIHEAELFGALVALRRVSLVDWNLLVCDRSAIFPVLNRARQGLWKQFRHHPIESRLARILQSLDTGWRPPLLLPSWKLNLDTFPERWNVPCPSARPGAYLSRVALQVPGLVAVDIKSHQTDTSAPFPFLVAGNEAQDNACAAARAQPPPSRCASPNRRIVCLPLP